MSDADKLRSVMASEGTAVSRNTQEFNQGRYESVGRLPAYEELKAEGRSIKEEAIERLPELIDQLRETVEANGGTLYLADGVADANEYVRSVIDNWDAERVVKRVKFRGSAVPEVSRRTRHRDRLGRRHIL